MILKGQGRTKICQHKYLKITAEELQALINTADNCWVIGGGDDLEFFLCVRRW